MISEVIQSNHINPQDMSELIGLIYDAALDANQWPILTHALSSTIVGLSFVNANQENQKLQHKYNFDVATFLEHCYSYKQDVNSPVKLTGSHEVTIGETLLPHFERAAQLNKNILHSSHINETLESVLDHVPIGIILVDIDGMVVGKNHQADVILLKSNLLSISKNKIVTHLSETTRRLHDLISSSCSNNRNIHKSSETLVIKSNNGNLPLSLLIATAGSLDKGVSHSIIFIAAPEIYKNIPLDRLQDLYGLTLAESRLVKSLINGKDLKTISHDNGVAISTTRSQLKSVFSKTDTSRQGDLIRLVLVSPAIISTKKDTAETNSIPNKKKNNKSFLLDINDHRIKLSDGRELCYREYGKPDGTPVILMHTTPASRQQMHADTELPKILGIRLIIPDRPGFGLSTPKLNRTILDWCDDIKQLLDHTGIETFGVIGYGSGTPYALAIASRFPGAIQNISLLSAIAPNYSVRDLRGAGIIQRMIYICARNIPLVLVQMIKQSSNLIKKDFNKYMEVAVKAYSEPDQRLLSDPHVSLNIKTALLDSADSHGRYFAQDIMLQVRDWEIDLKTISIPIKMWHGEKNYQNPIRFSILLEQQLPKCKLIRIPNEGQFLIYTKYLKHALIYAAGINTVSINS